MGINSFWETLNDEGECVNLFQIASDHIQHHGRPYRIAVDTPYWLFRNLDEESVEAIREMSHRASNPIEKAILYRLMRFACHGIQVCLVFDGPGRPVKRGRQLTAASHALVDEKLLLLREAAQELGVVILDAPAEAEAECANMMRLGVVDAVWSEDSDVFLFRGETLLRFHYAKPGHKDNVMVRMYRMSTITAKLNMMDWRDVVLFAILVGGDYAVMGLPGCGPRRALEATSKKGLGPTLIEAFKRNKLPMWREKFQNFIDQSRWKISLPGGFPDPQVLKNYIEPQVSSMERLRSSISWGLPVDQSRLKVLITTRFNFSVQEYIRWVVRLLLSRKLSTGPGPDVDELELQFIRGVSTKDSGNIDLSRVSFLVGSIVPSKAFLETWPVKDTIALDRIKPYVHEDRIECDIPDSIVRLAAPDLLKDKLVRRSTTRKSDQQGGKHKSGRTPNDELQLETLGSDQEAGQVTLKRKRGRPRKSEAGKTTMAMKAPQQRSLGSINQAGRESDTLRAHHEEGQPVEEDPDSNDDFPDLMFLGRKKPHKGPRRATTFSVRDNHVSRSTKGEVADDALRPEASYNVQGQGSAQRHREALSELASNNSQRITSGPDGKHQQKVKGQSCSQAIDLTSD